MDLFTDLYGFEGDDLDAAGDELERVLGMRKRTRNSDNYGGDYFSFGSRYDPGGILTIYTNHFTVTNDEYIQEDDFPELGLILLIEQRDEYVDHGPTLAKMKGFKPILLYRSEYPADADRRTVLFDLAKEMSKE